MKKSMVVCLAIMLVLSGCVTYKVQSGYVVTKENKKIEFEKASVYWNRYNNLVVEGKDFELITIKEQIKEVNLVPVEESKDTIFLRKMIWAYPQTL